MIDSFGHHILPLLPLPGAGGGKFHLPAAKAACLSARRINGVLTLAGRFELAVVPDTPDFFDSVTVSTKASNEAWQTIRETQRLQWVIPTRRPDLITSSLPSTWIGKGFQNVCVAYMAGSDVDLAGNLHALRSAPLQHRMIILSSSSVPGDLTEHLKGIDWVVFTGNPADAALAETIGSACRQTGAAFLFHQSDRRPENASTVGASKDGSSWATHPFGTKIDLSRPTLPRLMTIRTTTLETPIPSRPEPASAPPEKPALESTVPTRRSDDRPEPSAEFLELEVASPKPDRPAPPSAVPIPVPGDADVQDFARLDRVVRRGLATFIEVGHALAEIRDRDLWRAGNHPSWAAYCLAVGGLTKIHANRLIKGSELASYLAGVKPVGFTCPDVTPASEWQVRPLHRLPDAEKRRVAWYRAVERANGQPTEKVISGVVAELMAGETSSVASKPNRKQNLADTIRRIRELNTAGKARDQIGMLLNQLETLLKLA